MPWRIGGSDSELGGDRLQQTLTRESRSCSATFLRSENRPGRDFVKSWCALVIGHNGLEVIKRPAAAVGDAGLVDRPVILASYPNGNGYPMSPARSLEDVQATPITACVL